MQSVSKQRIGVRDGKIEGPEKDIEVLSVFWAMRFPPGFPRYLDHGGFYARRRLYITVTGQACGQFLLAPPMTINVAESG